MDFRGISCFFAVAMLGGTIQESWIQIVNLGFLLTDPTKKPQH
jgi:hypothetical protein